MSAESCCVTCGIVVPRRRQVLGRLAADGAHRLALDLAPAREIRQRLGRHGGSRTLGLPAAGDQAASRAPSHRRSKCGRRAAAGDLIDVHAELARHPADRRRRRRGRQLRCGPLRRRDAAPRLMSTTLRLAVPEAAAARSRLARGRRTRRFRGFVVFERLPRRRLELRRPAQPRPAAAALRFRRLRLGRLGCRRLAARAVFDAQDRPGRP